MKLWKLYKRTLNTNCLETCDPLNGLSYWQNKLFATILIYLLPLSFFALVPGVIMSVISGIPLLAFFDLLAVFFFFFIAFYKRLTIQFRKTIFILLLYFLSVMLLYFLGSYGPGLIYLLMVSIFSILIFPKQVAYASVIINTLICFCFGIAIYYKLLNTTLSRHYTLGSWIAVTSNLVIANAIIALLLPTIFRGLQNTIEELQQLKFDLKIEQRNLVQSLEVIKDKNKELEQFAYITSHDLQEPLRMISGFLGLLEKKHTAQLDENGIQYIRFASDGALRMKKIIEELLEYSVAEKKTYEFQSIDMNAMVKEYVEQNKTYIEEKGAVIRWDQLPVITADTLSMQQVLQNLVGNAIKYQKKDTKPLIAIKASETKRYWQFAVSDNGIGIESRFFDKIFIMFQRLHNKSEFSGTGIGLAICKKIVENHKGKIGVESVPGLGSTFYFTIAK